MAQSMPITCPQCGLYKWTRKVSAVYNEGKFDKQSMGMSTYGTHYMSRGTTQSALSSRLSPPLRPDGVFTWGNVGIVALLVVSLVACLCAFLSTAPNLMLGTMAGQMQEVAEEDGYDPSLFQPTLDWTLPIACGSIGLFALVGSVPAIIAARKHNRAQKAEYDQAYARWKRLWYCGGCDITFDPSPNK